MTLAVGMRGYYLKISIPVCRSEIKSSSFGMQRVLELPTLGCSRSTKRYVFQEALRCKLR